MHNILYAIMGKTMLIGPKLLIILYAADLDIIGGV